MTSLNRHLLESGDHGRLGFHPACPVCRQERLLGVLPREPLFSHRARAVLATGVLAFSAAAPGVTIADEPDRQQEGVVAPDQPNPASPQEPGAERPSYDPGGDATIPDETGSPVDGPDGDSAPLEPEPVQDPDAPSAPRDSPDLQVAPGADAAPAAPVDTPPPTLAPVQEGNGRGVLRDTEAAGSGSSHRHSLSLRAPAPERYVRKAPGGHDSAPVQTNTTVSAPPDLANVPAASPDPDVPPGARTHVVKEGESLWSIARDVLTPGASDDAIAHMVARLWVVNSNRIGTGDPDVLPTGTILRLR